MKENRYLLFAYYIAFFIPLFCPAQNKINCLSRQYVIEGAQQANQSYAFSELAYYENNQFRALKNIDSALLYIEQALVSIDSAIVLAADTELLALEYANRAKKFAMRSYKLYNAYKQTANYNLKQDQAKQALFYAANATTDAYHASFYFKNCKEVKEEKPSEVIAPPAPKQLTKLDVDQALFALLNLHLNEKTEEHKKEVSKLSEELKAAKDPVKAEKIKEELKLKEKQEAELTLRNKHAQERLNDINIQIDERDKNKNTVVQPEETVFSKSMTKPADEWNKQVVLNADLPMGLVYQVQVGVYKNNIMPEIFKGLTPIFGKTVPGGTSYATGMFEKAADAEQAKTYVKSIGLTDAFIVAYHNRTKITLAEALKLEKK
jgi:hypothetical protein